MDDHAEVVASLRESVPVLERIAVKMCATLSGGGKIFWMGNGGSAADSQHLAAELVGRFERDRKPLASIALSCDTSILTAVSNDMGYDAVFSRQIEALCCKEDLVIGISTSGSSKNVLEGLMAASFIGTLRVGFTGKDGGAMKDLVDECLCVSSDNTARIQEAHILAGHILCCLVEEELSRNDED
jgi:D-sedoheptulose 7-phosphate isomerase